MITIHTAGGGVRASVVLNEGAKRVVKLMEEDYVEFSFQTNAPVAFERGDHCVFQKEGIFYLTEPVCPEFNEQNGAYKYTLKMEAQYRRFRNNIFFYDRQGTKESSWSLTAPLSDHAAIVRSNIKALSKDGQNVPYTVSVGADVTTEARFVQYDGVSLLDALTGIAEAFDTEWVVFGSDIRFGKCLTADSTVTFEMGGNCSKMVQSQNQSPYATRVYAFGSDRNIPRYYRKKCMVTVTEIISVDSVSTRLLIDLPYSADYMPTGTLYTIVDGVRRRLLWYASYEFWIADGFFPTKGTRLEIVEGIDLSIVPSAFLFHVGGDAITSVAVTNRLMLPEGIECVDAKESMRYNDIVESIVVFDDVYPKRVGRISEVERRVTTREVQNEAGEPIRETITEYCFRDGGMEFHEKYLLPKETLKIVFQSGMLSGMTFEVQFNPDGNDEYIEIEGGKKVLNPDAQLFKIIWSEESGVYLPNETLYPKGSDKGDDGDTYILSGFDISYLDASYIPAAEQELLQRARDYLTESRQNPSTYDCTLTPASVSVESGDVIRYQLGQSVQLVSPTLEGGARTSRIIGFEWPLDLPYDHPVYTVGETPKYSRLGSIEAQLGSVASMTHASYATTVQTASVKGVPYGGASGELLMKASSREFDTKWGRVIHVLDLSQLPGVGNVGVLYVCRDEGTSYVWDAANDGYVCVGLTKTIRGGNANGI